MVEHNVLLSTVGPASLSGMQHLLQGSKSCPRKPRFHFHQHVGEEADGREGAFSEIIK